jgi:hypothetical protein
MTLSTFISRIILQTCHAHHNPCLCIEPGLSKSEITWKPRTYIVTRNKDLILLPIDATPNACLLYASLYERYIESLSYDLKAYFTTH